METVLGRERGAGRGRGRGRGSATDVASAVASIMRQGAKGAVPGVGAASGLGEPGATSKVFQTAPRPRPGRRLVLKHLVSSQIATEGCVECTNGEPGRHDEAWQCDDCFSVLHLACMQAWIVGSRSATSSHGVPDGCFLCPACGAQYSSREYPSSYRCYCNQTQRPASDDTWLESHCCDKICSRPLAHCPHSCRSQCHRGPCPPCPRPECARIRAVASAARSGADADAHEALAEAKARTSSIDGAVSAARFVALGTSATAAESAVGAARAAAAATRPAVAATTVEHDSHVGGEDEDEEGDDDDDDGGTLALGPRERAYCNCGAEARLRPAGKLRFRCRTRCTRLCSCGRHACGRRCCPGGAGECRECGQACGRLLACGLHRCRARCHPGRCAACPVKTLVSCACGAESRLAPCGVDVSPPECDKPCTAKPSCGHLPEPHKCHFGTCPACRAECGRGRKRCDHACAAHCHFPAECEPCAQQISVLCVGLHRMREQLCSAPRLWRCDGVCGAPLACGKHPCKRPCHAVSPIEAAPEAGQREPIPDRDARWARLGPCAGECAEPCAEPRACAHECTVRPGGLCHRESCRCEQPESALGRCWCGGEAITADCDRAAKLLGVDAVADRRDAELQARGAAERLCRQEHGVRVAAGLMRTLGWEWTAPSAPEGAAPPDPAIRRALACGGRCTRGRRGCPHACGEACHPGDCPTSRCEREVRARCACRRREELWPCHRAQVARAAAGRASSVRWLQLLECTAECADATDAAATGAPTSAAPAQETAAPAPTGPSDGAEPQGSSRRRPPRRKAEPVASRAAESTTTNGEPAPGSGACAGRECAGMLLLLAVLAVIGVVALVVRRKLREGV